MEGKQKRIDGTRRALQLLRTACVVWPNSASEVLLAGSYDGWTTQVNLVLERLIHSLLFSHEMNKRGCKRF